MGRYKTEAEDIAVISGKLACAKKGIAFCQGQLTSAASKFKVALVGSSCEESRKIIDIEGDSVDDANENGSDDDSENEDSPVVPNNVPDDMAETDKIDVVGENIPQSNMVLWKFPTEVSQSTLDGRNGSSACSVIALIFAHVAKRELLDLQPTPLLSPVWVMLLCSAIRLGNKLYDLCRHSLPQRFLSASEAATIVERCVSVSVDAPLPVRVYDDHAPTTLLFQLRTLCSGDRGDAAVLIANEKTVLFMSVGNSSIVLVDTHRHGSHGAVVLLGHVDSLNQFVHVCQNVLELQDDTYANLSFVSF